MTTYQRSATASLRSINRLYHFTSKVNHMAVHVQSEDEMFQRVCEIAIDVGKFKLAWIGLIDEANQTLIARSSSGDERGYLIKLTPIDLGPNAPEGPALRMIRTGELVYCNDIENNPIMKPWHKIALDHGYRSSILLPIRRLGKIVGSFNIYSHRVNNFDENEIHLLREVTDNISFTLDNIEKDRLRRTADQQINAEKVLSTACQECSTCITRKENFSDGTGISKR
jgi:GAF domain-containing protein